jgi:dCTP deaminase
MLLSDREIWAEIEAGNLVFAPELSYEQVGPASIDLHLDAVAKRFRSPPRGFDTIKLSEVSAKDLIDFAADQVDLEKEQILLEPAGTLIGYTQESVTLPPYLGARVEGRSGFARLGLSIHNTAPTIQPGYSGQIALELSNNGLFKLHLEPGVLICQLLIERLTSEPASAYGGTWQGQRSSG